MGLPESKSPTGQWLNSTCVDVENGDTIASMRTYFTGTICPDCKQIPKRNAFDERWQCACEGKVWPRRVYGKRGTPKEHAELTDAGFHMTPNTLGDAYYVGLHGNIVWLFDDGTWRSDPDAQNESLHEYLKRIQATVATMI